MKPSNSKLPFKLTIELNIDDALTVPPILLQHLAKAYSHCTFSVTKWTVEANDKYRRGI